MKNYLYSKLSHVIFIIGNKPGKEERMAVLLVKYRYRQIAVNIDECDYPQASQYTWHYDGRDRNFYASIDGKKVSLHRYIMDAKPGWRVIHLDKDPSNNTRSNLCPIYQSINGKASKNSSIPSSRYRGVSLNKKTGKFPATIKPRGEKEIIGEYKNEIEAAVNYDIMAQIYYGRNARMNFPVDDLIL